MGWLQTLRNNRILRRPVLWAVAWLLYRMNRGSGFLPRAVYDSTPVEFLLAGRQELFVVSTNDRVIGRELFLHGEFDFGKLIIAVDILKREGRRQPTHLVDVGANIGSIVIPAVKRNIVSTATAIEPHPANLRLLRTNLALNEVTERVTVLGLAVGDLPDHDLKLHESEFNSGNHAIGNDGISVRSTRLDDLDLPTRDTLLWMDIEGYEGHALRGATNMLRGGVPVVAEFNPSFLRASGGFEAFTTVLRDRIVFDLSSPGEMTSIDALVGRYADGCTDILAI